MIRKARMMGYMMGGCLVSAILWNDASLKVWTRRPVTRTQHVVKAGQRLTSWPLLSGENQQNLKSTEHICSCMLFGMTLTGLRLIPSFLVFYSHFTNNQKMWGTKELIDCSRLMISNVAAFVSNFLLFTIYVWRTVIMKTDQTKWRKNRFLWEKSISKLLT